jgi:hypothetical protein
LLTEFHHSKFGELPSTPTNFEDEFVLDEKNPKDHNERSISIQSRLIIDKHRFCKSNTLSQMIPTGHKLDKCGNSFVLIAKHPNVDHCTTANTLVPIE